MDFNANPQERQERPFTESSAGFQTCCVADFQVGWRPVIRNSSGFENPTHIVDVTKVEIVPRYQVNIEAVLG